MKLTNVLTITLIIAALIFFNSKCYKGGDSVTVYDTVYVQVKSDTVYVPVPKFVQLPGRTIIDSFIAFEYIPVHDTVKVYNDYYTTYMYSDSVKNDYGSIVINDTVTQNRITGRQVKTDFKFPEVTKTVTKTKKVSFGLQVGAGLMYNGKVHAGPYAGVGVTIRL